jgi:branched-chain amino acid transport system substrate-binding protein
MLTKALVIGLFCSVSLTAYAGDTPGVTATEIKVGSTFPFSGPASPLGTTGKGLIAYVNAINDRGGINGRKINLLAMDDNYSPPKTVEHTRRLVESDGVAALIGPLGTATNTATAKYLAAKKVPALFIMAGATKFTDVKEYPYTTTGLPSYEREAKVYARYISSVLPDAKIAILYQNDDLGRDFIAAFKNYFKADFDKKVIIASYEVADPTVDSQVTTLRASGAQVFFFAGTPRFAAQSLRKISELGWEPLRIVNHISASVPVLKPVGFDKAKGVITVSYFKVPSDPGWSDDPGMTIYRSIFDKYLPGADFEDGGYLSGVHEGMILEQVLKQCGDDLSRENIAKQAKSLKDFALPTALPGIKINTSETVNQAWTQLQLMRWNGAVWEPFGDVINTESN